MQPACADLADGLGGVGSRSGRDRRKIPVFFISVGVGGKMRVRGRDHEQFFVTDVSDPDDTPEDVDDDDEPEFCQSINHQSIINQSSCCSTTKPCSFTTGNYCLIVQTELKSLLINDS